MSLKVSPNTQRYIEVLGKVMGKNSTSQLILAQKGNSREFEQELIIKRLEDLEKAIQDNEQD